MHCGLKNKTMNREHEFRAWENGKMYRDLAYITMSGKALSINPDLVLIKPVIMEWTGLKDVDWVDIYEGDVIRSYNSEGYEVKHLIVWDDSLCRFAVKSLPEKVYITPSVLSKEWVLKFEKKVIGNIYENPELV